MKIKLKTLDDEYMFFQSKHIIYIDNENKQYRISNKPNKPIIANYGDIFSICYNHHLINYYDVEDLIKCINTKTISPGLKNYIKLNSDKSLDFKMGILNNQPIFYINGLISDLFLYDLILVINDKNIHFGICESCGNIFNKRVNQKRCDDCLMNDKSRKQYQSNYYLNHSSIGSSNKLIRNIKSSFNNIDQISPDYLLKYKYCIYDLCNKYKHDIDTLKKIRSLVFIPKYLLPIYISYKDELNIKLNEKDFYLDLIKAVDIGSFEACFKACIKQLPKREILRLKNDLTSHILNNKVANEFNKQCLIDEMKALKII